MKTITLSPQELTQQSFNQFGDVISAQNSDFLMINNGFARKYADLANVDTTEASGKTAVHIFVAKQRKFPLQIDMLEKHPFFSQAFIPREAQPFVIVVAPPGGEPDIEQIKAFVTNGEQGVNYSRGVWHFPLISLAADTQFVVIDRKHNADVNTIEQCVVHSIEGVDISLRLVE